MTRSWHLSRRTLLRGAGVCVALPLLEAMTQREAFADLGNEGKPPARAVFVYVPNGVNIEKWMPQQLGGSFTLSPTLECLSEFRNEFSVLSGLSHPQAKAGHSGADTWLTGADLVGAAGYDYRNSISVDQLAARHLGQHTRFPSLELSTSGGTGQPGYSHTLAFNDQGTPLPAEKNPRVVFNRLFANESGISLLKKRQRFSHDSSILDTVLGNAKSLHRRLGKQDQRKLDEYLNSVREVEARIDRSNQWLNVRKPKVDQSELNLDATPSEATGSDDYFSVMFSLLHLALQTDTTRICSFQLAREAHAGYVQGLPIKANHHELSHHGGDQQMLDSLFLIDKFYLQQLAKFLQRLQSSQELGESLLDRTMVMYGSGMNNGRGGGHSPKNLPLLVAGGRSLGLKQGQHLAFHDRTPLSNLLLTFLHALNLSQDSFSDSSGTITGLS